MNAPTKIKAFTLSEMLVVLLLTTIVVGLAFSILRLVQGQMHGINGNFERTTEFNLLRQSLWHDFNSYDGVWYDPKKGELVFANALGEKTYVLYSDYIKKQSDTFYVKIASHDFFFQGNEQDFGEIDALNFTLSKEQGAKQLFVYKKNAATSYLNK